MVLMNARLYRAIPNSYATNLVFASVTFDDEEIARLKEKLFKFRVLDAYLSNVVETKFIGIDV